MQPGAPGSFWARLGGWLSRRVWKEAVSVRAGRASARHEQGPGSGRHPALGWSSRRPAWRAGRNTQGGTCGKAGPGGLRGPVQASEVTSGSGQPGTPGSPPTPRPRPCHGKSETVWSCCRLETEPYTGSPPRGRHKGSGWPRVHEGPSVAKRDWRRRHPARGLAPGDHVDSTASSGPGTLRAGPKWSLAVCGCRAALRLASVACWGARGQGCPGPEQAEGELVVGAAHRHTGSGADNALTACYFCSPLCPRTGALWCKGFHRTPPWTVVAPFGVAGSKLTMEKTRPQPSCRGLLQPKIFM